MQALRELSKTGTSVVEGALFLKREIQKMQHSIDALARCLKPIIACVHGACYGAGRVGVGF